MNNDSKIVHFKDRNISQHWLNHDRTCSFHSLSGYFFVAPFYCQQFWSCVTWVERVFDIRLGRGTQPTIQAIMSFPVSVREKKNTLHKHRQQNQSHWLFCSLWTMFEVPNARQCLSVCFNGVRFSCHRRALHSNKCIRMMVEGLVSYWIGGWRTSSFAEAEVATSPLYIRWGWISYANDCCKMVSGHHGMCFFCIDMQRRQCE